MKVSKWKSRSICGLSVRMHDLIQKIAVTKTTDEVVDEHILCAMRYDFNNVPIGVACFSKLNVKIKYCN